MGLTLDLCEKIVKVTDASIPDEAYARADQVALDALSVALAGTKEEAPKILAEYVRDQQAAPQVTVFGFGFKTTPFYAAYLNGASMHVLDFEPMSNPANHATSPVLPGVLALAERSGADGRTIATALIKGIEMEGRLRIAEGHPGVYRFHTPGVVGPMGSAVAAAHMLGLDATRTAYAIAIAAGRSAALSANSGTMTKSTHCGFGGANGVDAALLASRGFTASDEVLEHRRGFASAYLKGDIDPEGGLLDYGETFCIIDPGYALKLFPCQYTTHWGINAGLEAREKIGDIAQIEKLILTIPEVTHARRPLPDTGLSGKFSMPYTLAAALLDGPLGIDHFTDDMVRREDIRAMMERISLTVDPNMPAAAYERWFGLDVLLKNGDTLNIRIDKPLGHYHREPVTPERHRIKIHDCLSRVLSAETEEEFVSLAGRLHQLSARDVARLVGICG